MWEKEKMLVISIFSFSNNVFKKPVCQGGKKSDCFALDAVLKCQLLLVEELSSLELIFFLIATVSVKALAGIKSHSVKALFFSWSREEAINHRHTPVLVIDSHGAKRSPVCCCKVKCKNCNQEARDSSLSGRTNGP